MRFALVSFLVFLLPSLVASKTYSPPPSQVPTHGDFVHYSNNGATHGGIVVGIEHQVYPGSPLRVAPLAHNSPSPPANTHVHVDQIVEMHPNRARTTGHSNTAVASDIAVSHYMDPPTVSHV